MTFRAVKFIAIAAFGGSCLAEQMLIPNNGLQALDKVEQTLHKMLGAKTDKAVLKLVAPVVELVDKTAQEVESGKLTKKASSEKVLFAIKALQGLQDQLEKGAKAEKVETLQKELVAKKAELAKEEGLLKLEKELAAKKQQLEVLEKEKDAAASQQKEQQEGLKEESMVAGLVKMAHDLAATKSALANVSKTDVATNKSTATTGASKPLEAILVKSATANAPKGDAASKATAATTGVAKTLEPILMNLKDRAHNVSADLDHMDAAEKERENKLDKLAEKDVPTAGKTDAIKKGAAMIKQLKKREQRSYKKARALKQSQLGELNEGIHAIETGDVAALSSLMSKMQTELKKADSRGKGFLH